MRTSGLRSAIGWLRIAADRTERVRSASLTSSLSLPLGRTQIEAFLTTVPSFIRRVREHRRVEGQPEILLAEGCASNDVQALTRRLLSVARARGFETKVLGHAGAYPIYFFERAGKKAETRLLVAAGFHGEEPGGPWGLLRFLEQASDDLLDSVHLSCLPLVNPQGFARNRRLNDRDENPNRGFTERDPRYHAHTQAHDLASTPSVEGKILVSHLPMLLSAARDGFLTLHEDCDEENAYLYVYGRRREQGERIARGVTDVLFESFPPVSGSELYSQPMNGGVIDSDDMKDGSFEQLLYERGVSRLLVTETPGKMPMDARANTVAKVVSRYVALHTTDDDAAGRVH